MELQDEEAMRLRETFPPSQGVLIKLVSSGRYLSLNKSGSSLSLSHTPAVWTLGGVKFGYFLSVEASGGPKFLRATTGYALALVDEDEAIKDLKSRSTSVDFEFLFKFQRPQQTICHILCQKSRSYLRQDTSAGSSRAVSLGKGDSLWEISAAELPASEPRYSCPSCNKANFTEDELWYHWPKAHGRENDAHVCPICEATGVSKEKKGSLPWGFSGHMMHGHGPGRRQPNLDSRSGGSTHSFALVVCRNPKTKKYLLVEEGCSAGFWLPAGRVDPGESFQQAALRETVEEAGMEIDLKGILRIEYSPFREGGGRCRVVFYAEPRDPDAKPKSVPDYESFGAHWVSWSEFDADVTGGKKRLRGGEPLEWFAYVERGGKIFPIDLLTEEGSPVKLL